MSRKAKESADEIEPEPELDQQESAESDRVELDPTVRHEHVGAADEQGFIGVKVDPYPNEAYSLESGTASPGVVEARLAVEAANQPAEPVEDEDPKE